MGVNSLWDILGPTARPVRLEALSRKKLAVDASIWIYQFLKAVRDAEGNSLPQSHIVGFFRRICKLLYFGILPIFVFDGGAPALKRDTINQRRQRRQGNSDSTRQSAQKLLAIHVQREAERARAAAKKKQVSLEDDDDVIYLEDLPISHPSHGSQPIVKDSTPTSSIAQGDTFKKADEYHLPDLTEFRVSKDDNRIMPEEEYLEADFDHVDGIDINTVDPKSKEFLLLPTATQYMILSHLRLRSRLRMGYRKEQLEELFPNSMEFSKFQIQQVQKRNFYTQKLMNVAGMGDEGNATRRIAGDKDRKYALVRNEDGWTLALQGEQSTSENPVTLDDEGEEIERGPANHRKERPLGTTGGPADMPIPKVDVEVIKDEDDSESDFEEVPLENRQGVGSSKSGEEDDDEFQKALIQSIYVQYENRPTEEQPIEIKTVTSDGFDKDELKRAVEFSKQDLFKLQEEEEKLKLKEEVSRKEEKRTMEKGDSIQTFADFSLGRSIFDEPLKIEDKEAPVNAKKSDLDFGSSFLFRAEETNTIDYKPKKTESQPDNAFPTTDAADALEIEKLADEKEETEEEGEKSKPKGQNLPVWFNSDIPQKLNPHNVQFISNENEYSSTSRKYQEDEEAGLISWSEARNYLEDDESQDGQSGSEYEDDDDVQVTGAAVVPSEASEEEIDSVPVEDEREDESRKEKESEREKRKADLMDYDFEEEEEEELVEQLRTEEADHEQFRNNIKKSHDLALAAINTSVTEEQLLQEQMQKSKRDSDEVTQNMITDVQELLKRFGIPYITAPMEAEAQCAELVKIGLVDGIITDDSDCFLFGGDRVYKNMFNQKQYVECYILDDIEAKVALNQDRLIELALLLGSDYTEGIKGIGPVLAMEILAEFGTLKEFKRWFDENTKTTIVKNKADMTPLQKNLLTRIKNGKLFLPDSFPDSVIFSAYKLPEVDHDRSEFKWGVPSLDQIRSFLMYNLRWTQSKVDEVLVPLIRDMNRKRAEGTQSTIGEFFPQEYIQSRKEIKLGKRMKTATTMLNKRKKTGK
ncbi:uncharacterized protein RJT20DRAFT_54120 [Scheffersomyces xylosifermentans]|uniref:uncharacterized protein n=1 Tax=Scheffersomyces xylosifermentans TaxID=1304137 RepID=UPI00315D50C6